MKRILIPLLISAMALACDDSSDSINTNVVCIPEDNPYCEGAPSFEACSDGTNSYYTYNGKRYDCNGNDCLDAAQQVNDDMEADCGG